MAAAFVATFLPGIMVEAGESGSSYGTVDVAQREIIRRQERIAKAADEEAAGDKAMAEGDYEEAIGHYRTALDLLPQAPLVKDQRERVIAKYANACVKLAAQRADGGEYDSARSLLNGVLVEGVDPDNRQAKKLLERLEDPEWYNPANNKKHTENVQQVTKHLQMGLGAYDLGDYNRARDEFQQALLVDPYNQAARRQLERLEKKISEYHLSSRDHTRAKMIRQVDELWETAVPSLPATAGTGVDAHGGGIEGSAVINDKLKSMIVSVQFDQSPIDEVVDFLRAKTKELDTATANPAQRGVNFILKVPNTANVQKITLTLTNVPLGVAVKSITDVANLRYRVEPFAVIITPVDEGVELYTRPFRVRPDFLTLGGDAGDAGGGAAADPFTQDKGEGGGTAIKPRKQAIDILKAAGIPFPEAASAFFNPATSTLTVRNTPANLDLVATFVEQNQQSITKMIYITSKFIEVSQRNTDEMGFDWLLGAFNVGGNRVFGTGGTSGNRTAGPVGALNWPLVPPNTGGTALPVGGSNLVTGGLRFGENAISNDAIDSLINAPTRIEGAAEASVTPAVFGLGGVFSDPQFQVVLRALNQKKGVDLLTAPSVMTRSGQRAKIEVIREFIYPTEFEPPQIPQDFGNSSVQGGGGFFGLGGLGGGGGGGGAVSSFPVTPTTPTAFETKNTGVTLEVEPTLGPDGYTIDLTIAPEVVEFEGFVNYGSPIQTGATDALGNPTTIVLTENRIVQPIFSSRKLSTSVTIWDGMTLGIGGLIREDVQSVEDKVPFFGDIPYLGRLFRTKADQTFKRNLMMFVTVKLMDPSGNPVQVNRMTTETTETGTSTENPILPPPAPMGEK